MQRWFEENTGHEAIGVAEGDLETVGTISTEYDGQVIENKRFTGSVNVNHDNVTIRGCRFEPSSSSHHGRIRDPAPNLTVEYCTWEMPEGNGSHSIQVSNNAPGLLVRYNKWTEDNYGGTFLRVNQGSGTEQNPIRVEYNYMAHRDWDTSRPTGIGLRANAPGYTEWWEIRRNWVGGYENFNIYNRDPNDVANADHPGIRHIVIEENLLVHPDRSSGRSGDDVESNFYNRTGGSRNVSWDSLNRSDTSGPYHDLKFNNNKFSRWSYPAGGYDRVAIQISPHLHGDETNEFEGNVMLPAPGWPGLEPVINGQVDFGNRQDWTYDSSQVNAWSYEG